MATKTRRPVAVVTPPPRARSGYNSAEKQSLLDNFDLEVADKTRAFRSQLQHTLAAFLFRQETEIFKIPRELRNMTLGDLSTKWAGSWAGTVQRIAREKIEEAEREREREEREKEKEREGQKRKRGTVGTLDTSPDRKVRSKAEDKPTGKRKGGRPKKVSSVLTPSSRPNQGPSSLPQDHVFNPSLPPTPKHQPARPLRRHESMVSLNGSPLANPLSPRSTRDEGGGSEFDLPDPEEMERQAQSSKTPSSKSSKSSKPKKRAPSLMFRQSMAAQPPPDTDEVRLAHIPLSDGRTLSFNPLQLTPGRIDDEMDEGGLGDDERAQVKVKVREEVVRALTEKMERWKVL